MLPLQQAYEVQHSILEYLKATFGFKDKPVHDAFYQFITSKENGIFKGPYISLKLPFVSAPAGADLPLEIKPDFAPYFHQYQAFQRLSIRNGHHPQPTLITTGTSSGKTECFLYPVLDYCYENLHRNGIKVIILYPMNALATDQAKRLAESIWNEPKLKGKLTAGLFIGEGKDKKKFPSDMGATHIIENREVILSSPPDILLTNFKMLDYALMRNNYNRLWCHNFEDPGLLQYLVLDELHTYDGAQGTDVANLIRRLKLKLAIPKGQLCPVGTSATIGSGADSKQQLAQYAEKVFGEAFDEAAVITENRLNIDEFFDEPQPDTYLPRKIGLLDSRLKEDETYAEYIGRQKRVWQFPEDMEALELGNELKKLKVVKELVSLTNRGIEAHDALLKELAIINPEFSRFPAWDETHQFNPREEVINSLLALISEAKTVGSKKFPLLYLQVQSWIRELSNLFRSLSETPSFTWKDEAGGPQEAKALPAYYCRECGSSGWLGVKDDNKNYFSPDYKQVYEYYFNNHKNIYFINTYERGPIDEYEPTDLLEGYLDPVDLSLNAQKTPNSFKIKAVRKLNTQSRAKHTCPECNTENTLSIIGSRISTLSSITVSQMLSSNLDPRTEKERKILAFTNSVQDAAHQASFLEARNYRFTFRASLQKTLNAGFNLKPLNQLQEGFTSYWKAHSDETNPKNEEAYYYRYFPEDFKAKADLQVDYRIAGELSNTFKKEFDERMSWEVASEFGYNSIIGRTLEKTGASAIKFDENILALVFPQLQPWLLQNNLGMIQEANFLLFIHGLLHRIRMRGGVDHPYLEKFRTAGLFLRDLNWIGDSRHFLNRNFGPNSRFPRMVTTAPHTKGLLDTTYTQNNNWYRSYFLKSFPLASSYHAIINDFYKELFKVFEAQGIVNKKGLPTSENYALVPQLLLVENKVRPHLCEKCGSHLHVAASDTLAAGTPCLNYTCAMGIYVPQPNYQPNYYQKVYNRKRSPRVYASEHTGLLERKIREEKEIDFKERPRFNSLNAIVATSTLEMGINIGTLNTAINNSVPPLPSNFLQRVGRAGRASGTALILNFATAKPHDLFYYSAPEEMMEGDIGTPGCFLEAKEILFRHYLAYCIDHWSKEDPTRNGIPAKMIFLRLLFSDLSHPDFFVNRLISFIKSHERALLQRFADFYRPDLDDDSVLEELKKALVEETFYLRLKTVFERMKQEYQQLHQNRVEIDAQILQKKLPETDEERKTLEREKKALYGLKRILDNRSVLEHLTNVGLLPNYAFPETGVTLHARIWSMKAKSSDALPVDRNFEIVRSSAVAIKELAPDNIFYSQGYKFSISGLHTYDWKEAGTLLRKRFCSNCDHLENDTLSVAPVCPVCGDHSWSSAQNQHVFVKLSGVKSDEEKSQSTLDDSKEDRDSKSYFISRHIRFDPKTLQGAWGMRDVPFGIEYVKNADITEINLGLSSGNDANKVNINQLAAVPYHGFITCRYCGKSSSDLKRLQHHDKHKFHYNFCKHRDKVYEGKADAVFEEVYLFKEMKTEALKVLLPVQDLDSEMQIKLFKAGLELGLRKFYKGQPAHLNMADYSEFNKKTARFDRYLVLYDSIPGGTGYLEKLFDPENFTRVLQLAFENIRDCDCQKRGRDGCYQCIFTYANQFDRELLSRTRAEQLFSKIIAHSGQWESFETGLGLLSGDGRIEESELEERFVRSMRNHFEKKKLEGYRFEEYMEDGIIQYKFCLPNGPTTFYYTMRPQYSLGPAQGVAYHTRSDFYIKMVSVEKDGEVCNSEEYTQELEGIAVYLDGYTYHATAENNRFFKDLETRRAIAKNGNRISWTLSWNDLDLFDIQEQVGQPDKKLDRSDALATDVVKYKDTVARMKSFPTWKKYDTGILQTSNSLERLLFLLSHPLENQKAWQKINFALFLRQSVLGKPSIVASQLDSVLYKHPFTLDSGQQAQLDKSGMVYFFPELPDTFEFGYLKTAILLNSMEAASALFLQTHTGDFDKKGWEQFWQLYNLTQLNLKMLEPQQATENEIMETVTSPTEMEDNFSYYDEKYHPILKQLQEKGVAFNPEGGFNIQVGNEYPEADLGFESVKIFLGPRSEEERQLFLKKGYRERSIENFDINEVMP